MSRYAHERPARPTNVITYRMVYTPETLDLCERHASTMEGLGPVTHGQHWDSCDECSRERSAAGSS